MKVTLTATAAAQRNFATSGESSLNAIVTATSSGKPALRLPVFAMFQHVEKFTFAATGGSSPYGHTYTLTTGVQDAHAANGTSQNVDLYSYVWLARDGRERIGNGADIKNIGINANGIDVDWAGENGTYGSFAMVITSWDLMSNAALNEWDIELDSNNDGTSDQVIIIADYGWLTQGDADGTLGCFFVDNLAWGGVAGALWDLTGDGCDPYVNPVSSVVHFSIDAGYLWDSAAVGGAKFKVTSYNGGGWDEDSTGSSWLFVSYDDVATADYVTTGSHSDAPFVPDLTVLDGALTGSETASLLALGHPSTGGRTPNLGWLMWNEYNAGSSSEIYEILHP